MSTIVTLEDNIYEQVVAYASARNLTLEKALGELVRKSGAVSPTPSRLVLGPQGLRIMPKGPAEKQITQERMDKARDEGYFG